VPLFISDRSSLRDLPITERDQTELPNRTNLHARQQFRSQMHSNSATMNSQPAR